MHSDAKPLTQRLEILNREYFYKGLSHRAAIKNPQTLKHELELNTSNEYELWSHIDLNFRVLALLLTICENLGKLFKFSTLDSSLVKVR